MGFDFDRWKATHRHFLPGYHIYSSKNLSLSRGNFRDYLARMHKDLEDHYAGRNNRLYRREYTPKMQAWVEPYARHIFQESRIVLAVEQACRNERHCASSEQVTKIAAHVWDQFRELGALPTERRAARWCHIEVLVREALIRSRPT